MKKTTLLSVLAVCFAALSFTSCLNSDNDSSISSLSKEQQDNYQAAMALGSYDGMKLIYEKKNADDVKNQTDSVDTYCNVSIYKDSTLTIANFPIAALAEHITNKDLSEAISQENPRNIKCKYVVLPTSTSTAAYFYACPEAITLNLAYGETTHKVQLIFSFDSRYAGVCNLSGTRQMAFNFILYQINVDDKQTDYIKNTTYTNDYKYVNFLCRPKWTGKSE